MEIDEYKKIALNPDSWFEYARKQKKMAIRCLVWVNNLFERLYRTETFRISC